MRGQQGPKKMPNLTKTWMNGFQVIVDCLLEILVLGCPRKLGSKVIGSVGDFTLIYPIYK